VSYTSSGEKKGFARVAKGELQHRKQEKKKSPGSASKKGKTLPLGKAIEKGGVTQLKLWKNHPCGLRKLNRQNRRGKGKITPAWRKKNHALPPPMEKKKLKWGPSAIGAKTGKKSGEKGA